MADTAAGRGPAGMGIVANDVAWDRRYLQLEPPAGVHTFAEFGQGDGDVLLSPVAVTEPFRILSDEGVAVALKVARELEKLAVGDGRSKRMRGCTYRSRFFEGMYRDPDLLSFLATLARADLREHPVGHHRVQLNFAPEELSRDVDIWHHDVVAYDFVMLLTDPGCRVGVLAAGASGAAPGGAAGGTLSPGVPGGLLLLRRPAFPRTHHLAAAAQGRRPGRGPGGVGTVRRLPHHRAAGSVPGPGAGLRRRAASSP
jgi:hypothetical protein